IPEKSLVSLIQNDNLQMGDAQIWEQVLKWGLAKNPELSSDPDNLSKEDFNVLNKTLENCIPLIRFYNFTSKEFIDNVLPYKKILPKELYKELFKAFLNFVDPNGKLSEKSNPRVPKDSSNLKNIDSKIITSQ